MFKRQSTKTIAMCMYVRFSTKTYPKIQKHLCPNNNLKQYMVHAKITNARELHICTWFWICWSSLIVREIQQIQEKEHKNNCNVQVFSMLDTKELRKIRTINKNKSNNEKSKSKRAVNAKARFWFQELLEFDFLGYYFLF